MDHIFSAKQVTLTERIKAFVEAELPREVARECDVRDAFPHALLGKVAEWGFADVNVPEEYGGQGGGIIEQMIVAEEICTRLPVLSWAVGNILLYGNEMMTLNGSDDQRARFLPKLAKGELKFCFALTEPNAGSDAAAISTKAIRHGDSYVINGHKMFITGASVSDYAITLTRTAESRHGGVTAFIVDTKSPGYSADPIHKLGHRGSDTCAVYYQDVRVPSEDILGGEGGLNQGWKQEMKLLNQERLTLSACALGIARAALEDATQYAKERFGSPVLRDRLQGIAHRLVEMTASYEAMRHLAYYSGWRQAQGMECVRETSMAKYLTSETGKQIVTQGINIMGQDAANLAHDMQRYLRDILLYPLGGGTTQIQKNIIAKTLGL